eukprot:CAMPEP_0117756920 /NCGR_PEP_ID=MMETSP0947-20121206/14395_1 /TAXON_ID=44440 /ORGANISM="Chattonella subsalsa, Strain CCMP2191" /LENGTH=331 /DNA_ID=CAMNT_0005576659 /DNA_START=22 /DNA_END=1014 /DNA_ORIENTATION=-
MCKSTLVFLLLFTTCGGYLLRGNEITSTLKEGKRKLEHEWGHTYEPIGSEQTSCLSDIDGYTSSAALSDNFQFWWKIEGSYIHAKVRWPGEGWGGWAVSTDGRMIGADSVIGSLDGGVQRYNLGAYALSGIQPFEQQNLFNSTIESKDGNMEMAFVRPLLGSSGDEIDMQSSGNTYILWAYDDRDYLAFHYYYGSVELNVTSCETRKVISQSNTMINTHAILMSLSWGVLLPIGAVLPAFKKTRFHKICQAVGFLVSIVAIVLAYVDTETKHKEHFSDLHAILGVFITCATVVQVVVALLRPRKVEEKHEATTHLMTKRRNWEWFHGGLGW